MLIILQFLFRLSLALLFIFSAYTKLFPTEYFEYFLYKMGFGFFWVQWLARLIIWAEFAIGFGFLIVIDLKKIILPSSFLLLMAFNFQLLYSLIMNGNNHDCGCFGNYMSFTPIEALIKNAISVLMILFLYFNNSLFLKLYSEKFNNFFIKYKVNIITYLILLISPISYILSVSPPAAFFIYDTIKTDFDSNLNVKLLYESEKFEKPKVDFAKGKYILAFVSLTCPHCKLAALKLHALKFNNPEMPIWMVINGETEDLEPFFKESKANNVPYFRLNGPGFIEITKYEVPAILMISDTKINKKIGIRQLDETTIQKWLLEK